MSEPTIACETCGRSQRCYQPGMLPETARRKLKRQCPTPASCSFTYRAGFAVGGPPGGTG